MGRMPDLVDDDDPETLPCYRHPDRQTALACVTCDRPICPECAVQAAVGFKCPDDARQSRAARASVPANRLALGIVAGTFTALVGGVVLATFRVAFFGIVLAYLLGMAVGEVTRRASGGYRDPVLVRVAVIAAVVGILLLPVLGAIVNRGVGTSFAYTLIAAAAAGFGAANRVNS